MDIKFRSLIILKKTTTIILLLCLTSCSLRVLSPYDAYTDDLLMQLSTEISTFFETMKRLKDEPGCEYVNHKNFYIRSNSIIDVLILRNQTRPESKITIDMLESLKDDIKNLENYHKNRQCEMFDQSTSQFIWVVHDNFNTALESILEIEEMKRSRRFY